MSRQLERPLDHYSRRISELRTDGAHFSERYRLWMSCLLATGLIAVVLLFLCFGKKALPIWAALPAVPTLAYLAEQARRAQDGIRKSSRLREGYEKGIARIKRDWTALDEGNEFADGDHLYATALDLFGRGSMFQLLCSARTQAGRATLADWMKTRAKREDVIARREAICELRDRHDLRESLALAGETRISDFRLETFQDWLDTRHRFPRWASAVAFFLVPAAVALAIAYGVEVPSHPPILSWGLGAVLCLELVFSGVFFRRVRRVLESVRLPAIELPILLELVQIIERERFSAPRLVELSRRLKGRMPASTAIRRLRLLIRLLNQRDNAMFTIPSFCLLWATQFAIAIENWRRRHAEQMSGWLAAVGEFEALMSLAAYAYEHPRDTFPELTDDACLFDAEGLGHPLLDDDTSVRNDVRLASGAPFLIVSGSNMSGKSTFLRAVGLNAALAWMGAPVRCTRLRLSELRVGAAIDVHDSLADGQSHFFAEMQRLRRLIEESGKGRLLFLADEMMSGTNSRDRRIAAEWVIRAFVERGAIGLITTHDLALAQIACDGLEGRNVHFADTGEAGNLCFDYKLRPGVLTGSNALNIARMLGIDAFARAGNPEIALL